MMVKTTPIPNPMKCSFDPDSSESQIPKDRIGRALWAGIKCSHLTDQYFTGNVEVVADMIRHREPDTFDEFFEIIKRSELHIYGSGLPGGGLMLPSREYDEGWWRQMWGFVSGEETLVLEQSAEVK